MATPKTAAIFWRSAGLGVQRPSAMAVTRPSSRPLRSAKLGHGDALFAAEIGDGAGHVRAGSGELGAGAKSNSYPIHAQCNDLRHSMCCERAEMIGNRVPELYRILAASIIPIDGI